MDETILFKENDVGVEVGAAAGFLKDCLSNTMIFKISDFSDYASSWIIKNVDAQRYWFSLMLNFDYVVAFSKYDSSPSISH